MADNGKKALDALERDAFDLILMDVQMPEMDGLTATGAIRANERKAGGHIPIVAMTANALAGDRERCLAAGMDDYVAKPVQPAALFDAIERWAAGTAVPATPTGVARAAASGGLDVQALVDHFEGDAEFARTIVTAFLEESPQLMQAIGDALAARDSDGLRRSAHRLKGSIGLMSNDGYALAAELESIGRDGKLEAAPGAYAALTAEMARLTPALHAFAGG